MCDTVSQSDTGYATLLFLPGCCPTHGSLRVSFTLYAVWCVRTPVRVAWSGAPPHFVSRGASQRLCLMCSAFANALPSRLPHTTHHPTSGCHDTHTWCGVAVALSAVVGVVGEPHTLSEPPAAHTHHTRRQQTPTYPWVAAVARGCLVRWRLQRPRAMGPQRDEHTQGRRALGGAAPRKKTDSGAQTLGVDARLRTTG
jgi:hypothetical protein